MAKINLSEDELAVLAKCINDQTEPPEELLFKLGPGFFDKLRQAGKFDFKELGRFKVPTLEYAGKRPESVIFAQAAITGGAAPLQVVRSFGKAKADEWQNMIVQGDNLQFLKTCYMNQDPLVKDKVKGKVKLVYIDPPFATETDFEGKNGETSYSDKVIRSEFIESLRERIIYLKELLRDDGCIFVHLDQKMCSQMKIIMDEVFSDTYHINMITWQRSHAHGDTGQGAKHFGRVTEHILFYGKTDNYKFEPQYVSYSEEILKRDYKYIDEKTGEPYRLMPVDGPGGAAKGNPYYEFLGVKGYWRYSLETMKELYEKGEIILSSTGKSLSRKRFLKDALGTPVTDLWLDVNRISPTSNERVNYPTQKPEALLERILMTCSSDKDLVLDVFAGSGTTAAVSEKLGRRWIACDFGKHAIYTMQKRISNIADSKKLAINSKVIDRNVTRCEECNSVIEENDEYRKCEECSSIYQKVIKEKSEKYGQPAKPFNVVSAGAYDFSKILDLRKNKDAYITFVLGLFGITKEVVDFSKKYKLLNVYAEKDNNPVEVYPVWEDEYLKEVRIDEDYLKGVIESSGGKLVGDYYIITPETCTNIGDTSLKNRDKKSVNFKFLKFPYKVLEDVSRNFQIEEQPCSVADINNLVSSVGFYFNEEVKIEVEGVRGGFKIIKFKTNVLDKNKELYKGLDSLAMVLIDTNYDGKIFNMDHAIYKKEIAEDGLVKVEGVTKDSRLIAIDKHGNESKITSIGPM